MASTSCKATIRPASDYAHAYVRATPGDAGAVLGVVPVEVGGYTVLDAQFKDGRNWLRLELAGGLAGWVRDDLLDIQGDCTVVGYGVLDQPTQASSLVRGDPPKPAEPDPDPKPPEPPIDPPFEDTPERIREAAFNITAGFEGGGYDTYQNYDDGIVSYGRFGFTLASGSLYSVLDLYLRTATSPVAVQLRNQYLQRVRDRDAALRNDLTFRDLLNFAADDPIMQDAQNAIATDLYWNLVQDLSINPRGVATALGQAFIFDTAIHHGARHDMIGLAEEELGVPPKSKLVANGITEQQLIKRVAQIRRDRLYKLADQRNLPGLKPRGDFWVTITQAGDWNLQGDAGGFVLIKPGRQIQVRNP